MLALAAILILIALGATFLGIGTLASGALVPGLAPPLNLSAYLALGGILLVTALLAGASVMLSKAAGTYLVALRRAGQDISALEALRFGWGRTWAMLRARILLSALGVFALLGLLLLGLLFGLSGTGSRVVLIGLFTFIGLPVGLAASIYLGTRLFGLTPAITLDGHGARDGMHASWQLTAGRVGHVALTLALWWGVYFIGLVVLTSAVGALLELIKASTDALLVRGMVSLAGVATDVLAGIAAEAFTITTFTVLYLRLKEEDEGAALASATPMEEDTAWIQPEAWGGHGAQGGPIDLGKDGPDGEEDGERV
jgi:hypothetical protein